MTTTSCLTVHAFVSKLAKVAAAVIAQPVGAVYAGGVWSTGLCESSGDEYSESTVISLLFLLTWTHHCAVNNGSCADSRDETISNSGTIISGLILTLWSCQTDNIVTSPADSHSQSLRTVQLVPEWQCRDEWCWQLLPVNPLGQLHLYRLASESSQAPPF